MSSSPFLKKAEHMKVIWSKIRPYGGSCNTYNCIQPRLSSALCAIGTYIIQHNTPFAGMMKTFDGNVKGLQTPNHSKDMDSG